MNQFAVDLSKFVQKANGNIDAVIRKIVLDIGTRIVLRSPVGDGSAWQSPPPKGYIGGRFRGNWQYGTRSTGVPSEPLPDIDRTGQSSLRRIATGVLSNDAVNIHVLQNNLPYAQRLETGWSKQAPSGMVGVTVVEYQAIVAQAVRSLK